MSIHISKNSKGLYDVRVFSTHKDELGKRKTKYKANIKNLTTAKMLGEEMQDSLDRGISGDLTFKELNELYLNARKDKMALSTVDRSKYVYEPVLEFLGNVKIDKINNRLVQQFVDKRQSEINKNTGEQIRKATVKREYSHLRAVLNWAVANDYLMANRVVRVEFRDDEEEFESTILSAGQLASILAKLKQDYYNLYIPILLCSLLGLRRGEALGLKWEDVDLENNLLYIKNSLVQSQGKLFEQNRVKTISSKRCLAMPQLLVDELRAHKKMNEDLGSEYVCSNIFEGKPLKPDNLTHKFHSYVKKEFGIEIRLHDLRHNLNQLMYECGVDNSTRARVLGHSDVKTTETIYTHNSLPLIANALNSVNNKIVNEIVNDKRQPK